MADKNFGDWLADLIGSNQMFSRQSGARQLEMNLGDYTGSSGFKIPDFGYKKYIGVEPDDYAGFNRNFFYTAKGIPRRARFGKTTASIGLIDQALAGDPLGAVLSAPIDYGLAIGANRATNWLTKGMMASPNPYAKMAGGALRLITPSVAVGVAQSGKRQMLNPNQMGGGPTGMTAIAAGAIPAGANSGGLGGVFADIPFIGKRYQQKKQAAVDIDIAKQAQQAALETQDPFLQKQLERELVAKQALLNTQGQLAQQITKMTGMMSLYDRAMSEQGSTRRARIQYDPRYKAILDPSSL